MSDRGSYAASFGEGLFIGAVLFMAPAIFDVLKERRNLKEIRSVYQAKRKDRR